MNRLCVTVLNNSESLPSLSLECPVLTQKNDWPLSVGGLHRGGQCGEIPKIFFPEASANRVGKAGRRHCQCPLACTCVALSPSAPGLGRSEAQSQDCSSDLVDHCPRQAVSQEGVLSLGTWDT